MNCELAVVEYKRKEVETVPAVQISKENIADLEKFYQTTFDLGDYLILPDLRDDTAVLSRRRASVWSKSAFEKNFEVAA